jgi:hypothetical protein
MQKPEIPAPHGLVVPEELEGKRPGWNSCDQNPLLYAAKRFRCDSLPRHGGTLVSNPPGIARNSCGKPVGKPH